MPPEHEHSKRLPKVAVVIAVASGKGGVGKSTVAANLALALSHIGNRVGLLDADIYGPSQHLMLGLPQQNPIIADDKKIMPVHRYGLSTMSFGFFIKPDEAVVWRGPMIARTFQQFVDDVEWGMLDYLVIDLPPGTGDIQLTLSQHLQVTGAVIVTTPQDVALADAIKGIQMFRKVNVEVLGIVENMSYFACPNCGHEAHIFSHGGGRKQAERLHVPFLGEIPLEEATRASGDEGKPIVAKDPESAQAKRFVEIAQKVKEAIQRTQKQGIKLVSLPTEANDRPFEV